ncbi:MAG: thiamine pyrophosphate-binding protein [Rhodocyclaceae bacterium]|nr:thiamine pyrophosphate-binding protein [Rhodocyclaceae bacterium]
MNQTMRVADYIAQRCVGAGAQHCFLVTGGGAMHLNDAFARHPNLTPVCFHHEQAAAIAAEAHYRTTCRLAVLNVTTGPGGVNALNGVYGAYVDSIAMLIVSGQVKRETYLRNFPQPLRQLGDQEVDIVSMARPVTKYAKTIQDPSEIRQVMDKAIFLATHGRPGPVWVDVPVDIQSTSIEPDKLPGWHHEDIASLLNDPDICPNTKAELGKPAQAISDASLDELIAALKAAKRPVLMAGTGVRLSGMQESFITLCKTLKVPVVTGWNAHDSLTNDNPYFAGRPGTVGDRAGNFTVQNADLLIVLGCRLNIRQISYNWRSFAQQAIKFMVDIDAAELDKPTLSIDHKIHADLADFIPALLLRLKDYLTAPEHKTYLHWCRELVIRYPVVTAPQRSAGQPLNPYYFIELLFFKLGKDAVVVTGNGSACVMSFQAAQLQYGQRLFTNSGNASMGYDLPAAIGACIARDRQTVICLAGDGSLMMNLQELQTLVGYQLPVKVIVLNNNGYHSIRQTQTAYFPDNVFGISPADGVSLPDFVALGRALGIDARCVATADDWLAPETEVLLSSGKPALIEIIVDPEQTFSPKLASRKLPDGSMSTPALDDMSPFLERDELAANRLTS